MAIREILTFPDVRLRQKARPVEEVDRAIRKLADDMLETMYEAPGIGLAAVQIGEPKRLVVIDLSEEKNQPLCLINPEILKREGEIEWEEGCLSVPGFFEKVKRSARITVQALDLDGKPFRIEAEGLLAVCIQHEIDHLEGRLFVDYLSSLKRERIRKQLQKRRRKSSSSA